MIMSVGKTQSISERYEVTLSEYFTNINLNAAHFFDFASSDQAGISVRKKQ